MTTTPERWRAVRALFDEALAQPEAARTAWLAGATAGDPELRQEVADLLAALEEADDRFELPAMISLGELGLHLDPAPKPGEQAGPYRLVRLVGRGGMGVVFEAHRDDDQVGKRVALKTLPRGMDSELILRRFCHERQILARLEHRNIATLLDGGVTEAGLPYFAMEFVEGQPIDRYCAAAGLGIAARLQLFRQVCGAVHYAHTNLVIHRDLKPSNILVTADGTVKLLDFGIAKLLDEGGDGGEEGLTQPGVTPLTSAYASPEQILGKAVTTATDVFSLGLVLFRLLAGRHPFAEDGPSGEETRRRIVEQAPPLPSEVVDPALPGGRRALHGDLDSIVLMALRKEPERRYSSVEQLSEDLRRYLAGLPVAAQPDSAGYRLRKFVRRNRAAVVAGVIAIVAVLAGLGAAAWQAGVARQERDRARVAAEQAAREQARAEGISRFLQNMLGAADPSWYSPVDRPGPQTTIGSVLDAAGRRAEVELAAQPDVLADVLRTLGTANQALRRLDQAQPQLERARTLHLALQGAASRDVALDEHEIGMALQAAGDLRGAERWLRQSLDRFRAAGDTTSDGYGRTLSDLGITLATSGRPTEAEPLIRASAAHRRRFDSTSVANAILLGNLGLVLSQQGKLDEAETAYQAALAAFERFLPREYFEEGYSLGNLAVDLIIRGRPAEARPLAEEQIALVARLLGPQHPTVGYGWVNLARALHALGDAPGALAAAQKAEAIFTAGLPAGHPDFARTELIQGQILLAAGQRAEAERRLRNALAIRRARLVAGSPHIADVEAALAGLLAETGRMAAAESLLGSALQAYRAVFGPADARTRTAADQLRGLCAAPGAGPACGALDSLAPVVPKAPAQPQ